MELLPPGSVNQDAVQQRLIDIATAPLNNPDIAPSVLPLVVGGLLIELYFGKHEDEELGWNTSVANAGLWFTTGLGILATKQLSTNETYAVFSLMAAGAFIGYMNFFHKWNKTTAFRLSSAGIIYTAAYIITVVTGTQIPVNRSTAYASVILAVATIIGLKAMKSFETPQDTGDNILNQ